MTVQPGAVFSRFNLDGQVALVTGAAGQLGRQFVYTLGSAGASVVMADVDEGKCRGVADALRQEGVQAHPLIFDVSHPEEVAAAFDSVRERYGRLDVLVNNAGIAVFTPFHERTFEEFMRVLAVNLGGTFLCTQAASRIMARGGGGRIVNIGSIYGVVSGDPRIYTDCDRNTSEAYAASKAGVIQMTRYWAAHLALQKIRVNCISPGGIFNHQGDDFVRNYSSRLPLRRMGRDSELNEALLYLASEASSYVTGHNLMVDGGWTAW